MSKIVIKFFLIIRVTFDTDENDSKLINFCKEMISN